MTLKSFISHTILLPCSKLYGAGVYVRNKMFDWKILRQHTFDVPVVVVGNIAVGGTGKIPRVESFQFRRRNESKIKASVGIQMTTHFDWLWFCLVVSVCCKENF